MADSFLNKVGIQMARLMQTIFRGQAEKVFPGSKLAKSIKVIPKVNGDAIGFTVSENFYGNFQDFGTLGRRAKSRKPFNPSPARRRGKRTWNPSGITPTFYTSLTDADRVRVFGIYRREIRRYVRENLPRKINLSVR